MNRSGTCVATARAVEATEIDASRKIADVVSDHEETSVVFHRFGLAPARFGHMTIAEACAHRGVDCVALLQELTHVIEESAPFEHGAFEWNGLTNLIRISPSSRP